MTLQPRRRAPDIRLLIATVKENDSNRNAIPSTPKATVRSNELRSCASSWMSVRVPSKKEKAAPATKMKMAARNDQKNASFPCPCGCALSALVCERLMPSRRKTWFTVSATEWPASANIAALPVSAPATSLPQAMARLAAIAQRTAPRLSSPVASGGGGAGVGASAIAEITLPRPARGGHLNPAPAPSAQPGPWLGKPKRGRASWLRAGSGGERRARRGRSARDAGGIRADSGTRRSGGSRALASPPRQRGGASGSSRSDRSLPSLPYLSQ